MGRILTEAEYGCLKDAGWQQEDKVPTFATVAIEVYTTLGCPKHYFLCLPDQTWLVYDEPIHYVEGTKVTIPVGVIYGSPEEAICSLWVAAKAKANV